MKEVILELSFTNSKIINLFNRNLKETALFRVDYHLLNWVVLISLTVSLNPFNLTTLTR